MSQETSNNTLSSGKIVKINPIIDCKEIDRAIEIFASFRDQRNSVTSTESSSYCNALLILPGEIRNMIYKFALDTNSALGQGIRTPKSAKISTCKVDSSSLLRLCKRINIEARSLMECRETVYIPFNASMDYAQLVERMLKRGISSIAPNQSTTFAALVSCRKIHIHLHVLYRAYENPNALEPEINPNHAWIFARLRQLLLVYTRASALCFRGDFMNQVRRKAVVHLDHHMEEWSKMVPEAGPYNILHIIRIMGEDQTTDWELRYYAYCGSEEKRDVWASWDASLVQEFEDLASICARYSNVKLVAEVYGPLTWSLEGRSRSVTRDITPSSTLWPSWPENVPWRMFPRVRSDKEVLPVKIEG